MSNHSEVELVVDPNQDELEAHFPETILHLLKEKLGPNSKVRLKTLTRDRSFQYSCPCPFHDDGKNPNGRIALGNDDAGPRLYCNSCSKTWFIQNLLEETGQSSGDLWASVQRDLADLQKKIPGLKQKTPKTPPPPEGSGGVTGLPRFGDRCPPKKIWNDQETPETSAEFSDENFLETLWAIWEKALGDNHRELLQRIGLENLESGFHSARVLDLNPFMERHGKLRLNQFRIDNPQLKDTACLVFPVRDRKGLLQTMVFRPIRTEDDLELKAAFYLKPGKQKYFNLAGKPKTPFGLADLKDPPGELLLCEGIRDREVLRKVHQNVLATLGGLTRDQCGIIKGLNPKKILLAYDGDQAGRNHTQKAIKMLSGIKLKVLDLPDGKDPADLTPEQLNGLKAQSSKKWIQEQDPVDENYEEEDDSENQVAEEKQTEGLPDGFRIKNDWIQYLEKEEHKEGKIRRIWNNLCSELQVVSSVRGFDSNSWGLQLKFKDREGTPHEWVMPSELMAGEGNDIQRELLHQGLRINTGTKNRRKLVEFLNYSEPGQLARCVNRVGWHNRQFVLPNGEIIGPDQGESLLLMDRLTVKTAFKSEGTLEDWKEQVASPCSGNSRLLFALSSAFAAALLEPLSMESHGFNFRGDSSQGKTALLDVAGSVWGGGLMNGYKRTWRNTSNALESMAQAHCDALLCLDEMGQVNGKEAGQICYMLANGSGKGRSRAEGGLREQPEWRVLFLSSGELGLAELMRSYGQRSHAGQEVRLVDLPGDAGQGLGCWEKIPDDLTPAAFTEKLKSVSMKFYGTPIRRFLDLLHQEPHCGFLHEGFEQSQKQYEKSHLPRNSSGQVQRVLRHIILVGHAGELAIRMGILPFREGDCMQAAMTCFTAWLAERGTSGSREVDQGIRKLQLFLEQYQDSRFTPYGELTDLTIHHRAGYTQEYRGENFFLIQREVFRQEILKDYDPTLIAKALRDKGLLKAGDGKNLARKTSDGKNRFYWVNEKILEDPENQSERSEKSETP